MYWRPVEQTYNGQCLAVAIRVIGGKYQEYAGRGRTVAEAKSKATILMWRESRRSNDLPEDNVLELTRSVRKRAAQTL